MLRFTKSSRLGRELSALRSDMDTIKMLAAQPLIQTIRSGKSFSSLHEAEFKVFSQFGDDGIIQYLMHRLAPLPDSFVEFGVGNYRESNTRFLLLNNNWRGLVLDGHAGSIKQIQQDEIYWRHTLTARSAWITRDNVNDLLREAEFSGEIGLLSIDIDGFPVRTVKEAFVDARFRDSRDKRGKLSHLTGARRFQAIADLEVYDLRQNKIAPLKSLRATPS